MATDDVLKAIKDGDVTIVDLSRIQAQSLTDDIQSPGELIEAIDSAQGDCENNGPQYVILAITKD